MKILLVISFLIIFILIHILIGQLDDLCEYEKKIKKAKEYIKNHQDLYTYNTFGKDLLEILGDKE